MLRASGRKPAIAMRGYAPGKDGNSDEAMEYVEALGDVPLAIGVDRVEALKRLASTMPYDCVVLDDGFQHRRIARELDVVVVDASNPRLEERLLPAGRLREPAEALKRADVVLVSRAASVDRALGKRIEACGGPTPLAWLEHVWGEELDVHWGNRPSDTISKDALDGASIAVSLGVGNPQSICETIAASGARMVYNNRARDHQPYTEARIRRLFAQAHAHGAQAILVTPKDWMKLRDLKALFDEDLPVWVPRLELRFLDGEAAFTERILRAATLRA